MTVWVGLTQKARWVALALSRLQVRLLDILKWLGDGERGQGRHINQRNF
jgi:hypothetical protein